MDSILSTVNINLFLPHSILPAESKSIIKLMPFIQEGFFPGHGEASNTDTGAKSKVIRVDKVAGNVNLFSIFSPWGLHLGIESREVLSVDVLEKEITGLFSLLDATFSSEVIKIFRVATVITTGFKYESELECGIYKRVFKSEDISLEWSFRQVRLSEVEGERIFNNISVNKSHASVGFRGDVYNGDAIVISVDNNTHTSDSSLRFSIDSLGFVKKLLAKTIGDVNKLVG
ncbi:hypothetical protein [Klebsiella pneumoniae]|uniref:hypothetical protein n=1 Tax=Klebsiella pneumoniae TaxID=573 RepID=UPI0011575A6A|nr:hypothetical protein [Klebsiella pneumoniae]